MTTHSHCLKENPQPAVGPSLRVRVLIAVLAVFAVNLHAQWKTQTIALNPGWNAVYLHVTPPADTLGKILTSGSKIEEVWLWRPETGSAQFIVNPQSPTDGGSRWVHWARTDNVGSELQQMVGNAAYLVRLSGATGEDWLIKGRPLAPRYQWTTTGLNFIGFPTSDNSGSPPNFSQFFPNLPVGSQLGLEAFRYAGSITPESVFAPANTAVNRGEAFWLKSSAFQNYFGPFHLVVPDPIRGFEFGSELGQQRLYLRNNTQGDLTVRLRLQASEDPPSGETPIIKPPPLIIRGDFNPTNLTYGVTHMALDQDIEFELQPHNTDGSVVEVILGVNRTAMTDSAGSFYAGLLRFRDSLNHLEVFVPVSAEKESLDGLWVGDALVTEVRHNLLQRPITAAAGN